MSQSNNTNLEPNLSSEAPIKKKCVPRIPNTHTIELFEICYKEYQKPYDPANGSYKECAVCFLPCSLVADILCCIPMVFGCYKIEPS